MATGRAGSTSSASPFAAGHKSASVECKPVAQGGRQVGESHAARRDVASGSSGRSPGAFGDYGEYLTDIVLEAVHHHGPSIVQMSRDRLSNRLVATRRVSRQRNVIHPTLMILFVSVDEGAALDRQALDAQMTRSAFVATALTASLSVSLGL